MEVVMEVVVEVVMEVMMEVVVEVVVEVVTASDGERREAKGAQVFEMVNVVKIAVVVRWW